MEPTVPEENNGFRVLAPPSHLVPCCPQESRYLAFSRAAIWSVVPTFPASCYAVRWQIRWQLDSPLLLEKGGVLRRHRFDQQAAVEEQVAGLAARLGDEQAAVTGSPM